MKFVRTFLILGLFLPCLALAQTTVEDSVHGTGDAGMGGGAVGIQEEETH